MKYMQLWSLHTSYKNQDNNHTMFNLYPREFILRQSKIVFWKKKRKKQLISNSIIQKIYVGLINYT